MRARTLLFVGWAGVALAALGLVVAVALGAVTPGSRRPSGPPDATKACAAAPGRTQRVSVPVAGQRARSALVHLPKTERAGMTLVVALHGAYANGAFMERYSALSRLADREGFAVIYPDAAGSMWRISAGEDGADVQFLDVLLDRALAGGCFNPRRVDFVGVSNGGGMAARFACAGDDRLAGLVAVAGAYGPLPPCKAKRPLSVLEIHGTADRSAPYGSPRDPATGVLGWVTAWAARDACGAAPQRARQAARILRLNWGTCRDGTVVEHLQLDGGWHAWPGADPPDPGPQFGISASQVAWSFLRTRELAPGVA